MLNDNTIIRAFTNEYFYRSFILKLTMNVLNKQGVYPIAFGYEVAGKKTD